MAKENNQWQKMEEELLALSEDIYGIDELEQRLELSTGLVDTLCIANACGVNGCIANANGW